MIKFIYATTEYRISAKDIAAELKLPSQEIGEGTAIEWDTPDDHLIIQNPRGLEAALEAFRGVPRINRPRLTSLFSECCAGFEINGYTDAFLRTADIFDESFMLNKEDYEWAKVLGYKVFIGGWGWMPSWQERFNPFDTRQDKLFFCGHTDDWWGGSLKKRREAIDICEKYGKLLRIPTGNRNHEMHADVLADCKAVICPQGHGGYHSGREYQAAMAGTLIVAYEDKKHPSWAFDDSSSVRLSDPAELEDFIANQRWNDPSMRERIASARDVVEQFKPPYVWRNITRQL